MKNIKIKKPNDDILVWKEKIDLLANTQIIVPKGVVAEIYTEDGDFVQNVNSSTSMLLNEKGFFGALFNRKTNKYTIWCFNQDVTFPLPFGGNAEYVDKELKDRHKATARGSVTFAVNGITIKGAKDNFNANTFSVQQYDMEIIRNAKEKGVLNVGYFKAILQDKLNQFLRNALVKVVECGDRNYIEHAQNEIANDMKAAFDLELRGSWLDCKGVHLDDLSVEGYDHHDSVMKEVSETNSDNILKAAKLKGTEIEHTGTMLAIEEAGALNNAISGTDSKEKKTDKEKKANNNESKKKKFCIECGAEMPAGAKFCSECGHRLN